MVATGAGAEMRQSLDTAVFSGMIGVTGFGLLFTPAFYAVVGKFEQKAKQATEAASVSEGLVYRAPNTCKRLCRGS